MQALDLSAATTAKAIVTSTVEGIVEPEDIQELLLQGAGPRQEGHAASYASPVPVPDPTDMSRVREKWHGVARLIAKGLPQSLVATLSGYTPAYLSTLLNNPAMEEMVELYRIQAGAAADIVAEKLRTVGGQALDAIADKLAAGTITDTNELVSVAKLGFDRSGHGPASTQHVVSETHVVDHARLVELNRAARAGSSEQIIPLASRRALPAPDEGDAT